MKIVLVIPDFLSGTSFLQQPLDFLYASTLLENEGHTVTIIDCRAGHLSFHNMIEGFDEYDLIVITTTPCDQVQNYFLDYRYAYSVQTVNYIKNNFPQKTVAVCGAHATVRPDLVFKEINADIIIKGEVIETLSILANVLATNSSLNEVPNIMYKIEGSYTSTKIDKNIWHPVLPDDLLPAYEKINMDNYFGVYYENNVPLRKQNLAVVQGGRGCPFSCTFCHNFYGNKINRRNPESIVKELLICQNKFNVKEVFFLDEVFTLNRNWVLQLCENIRKNNIELEYTIQTRVDCIDKELLNEMYKTGVKNIWLGIESADDYILDISKKGIHIDAVNSAIELIRKSNIEPHAFFMLGMPGETVSSINKTLKQIYECKIPYTRSVMICTPRYGTEYYDLAVKQYPHLNDHWYNLNAVKGLIANEMTPSILQKAKSILKSRSFIYEPICPQI